MKRANPQSIRGYITWITIWNVYYISALFRYGETLGVHSPQMKNVSDFGKAWKTVRSCAKSVKVVCQMSRIRYLGKASLRISRRLSFSKVSLWWKSLVGKILVACKILPLQFRSAKMHGKMALMWITTKAAINLHAAYVWFSASHLHFAAANEPVYGYTFRNVQVLCRRLLDELHPQTSVVCEILFLFKAFIYFVQVFIYGIVYMHI